MYDAQDLLTGIDGLVGWRQNADPDGIQLSGLNTSTSGLWFNAIHPLLTFNNLASIAPDFSLIDPSPTAVNTAFTAWLSEKTNEGILEAIESWLGAKFKNRTAKNMLAYTRLFNTAPGTTRITSNTGKLVGFEIRPAIDRGVVMKMDQVTVQLQSANLFSLFVFRSDQVDPVLEIPIAYTTPGSAQAFTANLELQGGYTYWIVYDQADISGGHINGIYDYTFYNNGLSFSPQEHYYSAIAFSHATGGTDAAWDIASNAYTFGDNFGLNFDFSARCDYTSFILDQLDIFKRVIQYGVGIHLLREMVFNPTSRVNRHEANISREQLLGEIEGDPDAKSNLSLVSTFNAAIEAVQFDETGILNICLPCRKRSTSISSIGPKTFV